MAFHNRHSSDLSAELQDILRRNGLQAHVAADRADGGPVLIVKGHDSPQLTYAISPEQAACLTDWGFDSVNRRAYNTLVSIISGDFRVPPAYVNACNAFSPVSMGLHGYTDTVRFGSGASSGVKETVFRTERPDGHLKPGELEYNSYGFYYKGQNREAASVSGTVQGRPDLQDGLASAVLSEEVQYLAPESFSLVSASGGSALRYTERISSDVYFSKDAFLEILSSHGLTVDERLGTLTAVSGASSAPVTVQLSADELDVLTAPALSDDNRADNQRAASVSERLNVLNGVLLQRFDRGIDFGFLDSDARYMAHPSIAAPSIHDGYDDRDAVRQLGTGEGTIGTRQMENIIEDRRWDGRDGVQRPVLGPVSASRTTEGTYRMTAVIDGREYTHEITSRQFDKFVSLDDYHRMRLVARVFPEAGLRGGGNVLTGIAASLLATATVAHDVLRSPSLPDIYMERTGRSFAGPVYGKPGVDTPQDIVSRMFETQKASLDSGLGNGRHL